MKLYNIAKDKIEDYSVITTTDGTLYVSKLSEEQLNSYGYYKVEYSSTPNRRYYTSTPTQALEGNIYKVGYTATPRPLEEVKAALKASIKARFIEKQAEPEVDTGLGFSVDGGYDKVKDFEIGKKYSFPSVKASDDNFYPVTSEDYDTIITAIETYGITLFQTKWAKEAEVDALADVDACILYEATPYQVEEMPYVEPIEYFNGNKTMLDEYGLNEFGVNLDARKAIEDMYADLLAGITPIIVTKYKNNTKDW